MGVFKFGFTAFYEIGPQDHIDRMILLVAMRPMSFCFGAFLFYWGRDTRIVPGQGIEASQGP